MANNDELSGSECRRLRADALHEAVLLQGEYEAQEMFRADETAKVLDVARVFYDWIVNGDPLVDEDCKCGKRAWRLDVLETLVTCRECGAEPTYGMAPIPPNPTMKGG